MAYFFDFKQDYFGLTEEEFRDKLSMYGQNTYFKEDRLRKNFSVWEIFLSPAVILTFIAGILCFFSFGIGAGIITLLADAAYVTAELYARKTADKHLAEIQEITIVKFRVIRSGKLELVCKEDIVPEDIIVIQTGERVPVDAVILESDGLCVDESIFTKSAQPVFKHENGDSDTDFKQNMLYSGSVVTAGTAVCKVTATGVDTRLYQYIGDEPVIHTYYTSIERVVRTIIPVAGCIAVALTFVAMIIRLSGDSGVIPAAFGGITMGLCFVPVGLGSIIRLNYTKGAMDMIKNGTAAKSYSDIERLNSLSVLCVEKEGAISKNHLEVRGIYARSEELLYRVAALAGEPESNDPEISALMVKAAFFNDKIKNVYEENTFISLIGDGNDSLSGAIWEVGGDKLCCIRGTPERILPMCKLSGDAMLQARKRCEDYYEKGCSVLAVACIDANDSDVDITVGFSYMFIGFAAFSAPLRDSVSAAVKTCHRAGVRVVMFTEENPSVAEFTARLVGIPNQKVVTGSEIEISRNNESEIDLNADIFAHIDGEQKKYIIQQLKADGELVAMAGIRTEDAAVLDTADVGITISQVAASCTTESADIIMNNDNISSIAEMISHARQIHRNIKSGVSVIMSGLISLVVLLIINYFSGVEQMVTPPIIAVYSMLFMPFCAFSFVGKPSSNNASMPPSGYVARRKLNYRFIGQAALSGLLTGVAAAFTYLFMHNGTNSDFARSCALVSLCSAAAAFVFLRQLGTDPIKSYVYSSTFEKASVFVLLLAPVLLIYIPFVNSSFGCCAIDFLALIISLVSGIFPALVCFLAKIFLSFKERL